MAGAALLPWSGLQGAGGQRVESSSPRSARSRSPSPYRCRNVAAAGIEPPTSRSPSGRPRWPSPSPPPQVVRHSGMAAITTPVGKVSVSVALGGDAAVRVAQRDGEGRDTARIDGGRAEGLAERGRNGDRGRVTVKVATAGAALVPLLVCKAPDASALSVASRVRRGHIHRHRAGAGRVPLPAGIVPPVKVTVVSRDRGGRTARRRWLRSVRRSRTPLGKVSVSGRESRRPMAFGLVNVMVRVEVPPALMVAGLKALPSVGVAGPAARTAHGDGDVVGIHRHCTISRQGSTGHGCAGIQGDARERENIPCERSGCTESRGAADLPEHVAIW